MASVPSESSFAEILNRTQQNLNRINQRYAPSSNLPVGGSVPTSSLLLAAQDPNSTLLRDRLAGRDLTNTPHSFRTPASFPNKPATNSISINEDILRDMLERITALESKKSEDQSLLHRVDRLEKLLANHESSLDHLTYESKDLQRQTSHLQSRISNMEMVYEANKTEHEIRRATNAKIDHWIKNQDHWRDDIDRLTAQIRKEMADFKHDKQDFQLHMQQVASKQDIDQVKDKVHLLTQQSVSVAISSWTESAEHKLRQLEREISLLKMGQSSVVQREIAEKTGTEMTSEADSSSTTNSVTAEMIAKALDAPTSSETLVRGMVAAEILQLQTSLETKMDRQLQQNLSSAFTDVKRALAGQFEQQIIAIGLMESEGPKAFQLDPVGPLTTSSADGATADADIARLRREFDRRVMSGKSKFDQLEKTLQDRVTNLSESLYRLQNNYEISDKASTASIALLQQRVEALVHQNESTLQTSLTRSQHHEQLLRQLDEKCSHHLQVKSEEMYQRLQESVQDFQETRLLLERRLLPLEQSARDWLHELRHQQDRIITTVTSHPAFVEASKIASSVEMVTKEVRENAASVLKMQSQVCWQKDFVSLSEKVCRMDHIVHEKAPEYFTLTNKLLETNQQLTGRMQQVEHASQSLLSESDSQRRRVESVETTALQTLSRVNVLHEELQLTRQRFDNHEQAYQRDHTTLKDLAGSVATRVQSVEGKLHIQQRTQEAEVNALRHQVRMVDDKVVHLDQSFQTLLINFTFQKPTEEVRVTPAVVVEESTAAPVVVVEESTVAPIEKIIEVSRPILSISECKPVDEEEFYERIITPRPVAQSSFQTSPLSDEKNVSSLQRSNSSKTHLVDIIPDHPVEEMTPLPARLPISLSNVSPNEEDGDNDDHGNDSDSDESSVASSHSMNSSRSTHSTSSSSSSSSHDDDDDDEREVFSSPVPADAVNFYHLQSENEDSRSVSEPTSAASERESLPSNRDDSVRSVMQRSRIHDEPTSSFYSDEDVTPLKATSPVSTESPAAAATVSVKKQPGKDCSYGDFEEFDADELDELGLSHPLPSHSNTTHRSNNNNNATATSTSLGQAPPPRKQLFPAADSSFSDWDASMDEESKVSPWSKSMIKPIQHASSAIKDRAHDPYNKDKSKWNRDTAQQNDNDDSEPEEIGKDAHSSSLDPAAIQSDVSSLDKRQISLDISDSSVEETGVSRTAVSSSSSDVASAFSAVSASAVPVSTTAAATKPEDKKKPSILEGLSDEDSSDLSFFEDRKTAKQLPAPTTTVAATTTTSAQRAALPTIHTDAPSAAAAVTGSTKPNILRDLSADESSDESDWDRNHSSKESSDVQRRRQEQQQQQQPLTAATTVDNARNSSSAVSATPNVIRDNKDDGPFSPLPSSTPAAPTASCATMPETPAMTPAPTTTAASAAPINTAGLSARERLRLRQEQMRAQRTGSSSANVSAVPSTVVSGANSPVQSPASPVTVPRLPPSHGNLPSSVGGTSNAGGNAENDGVMSFDDDEFD